jgi:hypothetical protein
MAVSPDEPRPPLTADEAIRHIMMDIKVTEVNPPGPFDNPALPVVHFAGKSRSIEASWDPNANSRIKGSWRPLTRRESAHANPNPTGTVSLTPEGEVRWQTISVFYGYVQPQHPLSPNTN